MKLTHWSTSTLVLLASLLLSNIPSIGQAQDHKIQQRIALNDTPPTIIADSTADYSGVQGQKNWYYGYYTSPSNSSTFQTLPDFAPSLWGGSDVPTWGFLNQTRWTRISAEVMHPNGAITSPPATEGELWAVRRWVSNISGRVTISGTVAKTNTIGGDGVRAYIFVNGNKVWTKFIEGSDTNSTPYIMNIAVQNGTMVDFVIAPNATDTYDSTLFTARITDPFNDLFLPLVISTHP